MRARITGVFAPVQAGALGDSLVVGMIVGANTASGVDVPTVVTNQYADWMVRMNFYLGYRTGLTAAGAPCGGELDLKSRRRLDEVGDTLWMQLYYSPIGAATTYSAYFEANVLLALP